MDPKSKHHVTRGSLFSLVENNKTPEVETLLSRGFSANVRDALDMTLLHIATYKCNEKMVKLLLKYEAKVDERDYQGRTPIHLAALMGNIEIFKLLINSCGYEGRSKNINIRTPANEVPLHFAAMQGHLHIIKFIIQNGGEIEVEENNELYPLNWAVLQGHPECVKELLKHIADTNDVEKYGELILTAVRGNYIDVKRFPYFMDYKRNFELSKVRELEYVKVIDILFDSGINFQMKMDYLPLSDAILHQFYLIAETLIDHYVKVDRNYLSKYPVFEYAAIHAPVNFIDKLLKAGADVSKISRLGRLAIHDMTLGKNYKILSLLIRAGADINAKTDAQRTIIDDIVEFKPTDFLFIYIILRYGIDIHVMSGSGQTGIHTLCLECLYRHSEFAGILIDWFLDFNVVNKYNETPLQYFISLRLSYIHIELIIKMMVIMENNEIFKLSQTNMDTIIYYRYLKFYQGCITELKNLKSTKVWDKISYFELINKPLKKLREYTRNVDLMDVFSTISLRDLFPVYGDMIKSRMGFAVRLRKLYDRSFVTLNKLIRPIQISDIVARKILSFLIEDELEKLSLM